METGFKSAKGGPKSPHNQKGKFTQLITIDEVMNETVTSHQVGDSVRDDQSSKLGVSSQMRNSRLIDFEQSVEMQSS